MSGKSTRRWLRSAALALFLSAAGPLTAQTSTVAVQNNRSVPVRIYLDHHPTELKLGTVGPMETMTLDVPKWVLRDREKLELFVQPRGQNLLKAQVLLTDRGPHFALLVPRSGETLESVVAMTPVVRDENGTTVTVRNDRKHAADVYVQRGSIDRKLGRVPAHSVMTFDVPEGFVGEVGQVILVPEEGIPLESQQLDLDEGRHLGIALD